MLGQKTFILSGTLLWRKSHFSYLSHFKTQTSSLCEKTCAVVLFWNISFHSRNTQVCKIYKFAKLHLKCHTLNQILIKFDGKSYLSQFVSKSLTLILCSKILLSVLYNMSLTVLLPWQHTGFQTSQLLKVFLAIFGIPFWYLLTTVYASYEFVALSNIFQAENH